MHTCQCRTLGFEREGNFRVLADYFLNPFSIDVSG